MQIFYRFLFSSQILDVPLFLRKGASRQMRCLVDDLGNPPLKLSVVDVAHPEAIVEQVVNGNEVEFTYQTGNIVELTNASVRCSLGERLILKLLHASKERG